MKEFIDREEKFIKNFTRITQFLTWPFLYILSIIFFRIKIKGRENLINIKTPFVLVANHINFYDSFLLRLALGPFTPHLPLRFMAVKKFNWKFLNLLSSIGVIDFIYILFGVFTIVPGRGIEENTKEAIYIIENGENVVIYPEGKIVIKGEVSQFKKGAALIASKTGASVLPLSFKIKKNGAIREKIYINIGREIKVEKGSSIEELTDNFYQAVNNLYREEW